MGLNCSIVTSVSFYAINRKHQIRVVWSCRCLNWLSCSFYFTSGGLQQQLCKSCYNTVPEDPESRCLSVTEVLWSVLLLWLQGRGEARQNANACIGKVSQRTSINSKYFHFLFLVIVPTHTVLLVGVSHALHFQWWVFCLRSIHRIQSSPVILHILVPRE